MKRLACAIGFVVIVAHTGVLYAQDSADRGALIREMINRSRLLEDAHFRLPRSVWQRFVVDEARGTSPAPVSCIRPRGIYRLKIDGKGGAIIEAEIHLLIFDTRGAGALAVLPNSLAWSEITLAVGDAKAAPLKPATVGKWLVCKATEPGHHVIRARAEVEGFKVSGGTFTLPTIQTVQTAVTLDSPLAFEVTAGGAPRMAAGSAEKGTHISLPLKPASKLVLNYRPPRRRSARQATYQVSGAVAWNFGPAAQQVSADLRIAILGGKSESLEITLPPTAKRVAVSGPDVREIRTGRGSVSVFFRGAISGRTRLKLNYELPAANGAANLGRPEINGGRWAGGTLVITNTAGGSEIQPAAMSGLKEIALGDTPPAASAILAGKAVLAYSITSAQWSVRAESMNLGEFAIKQTIADSARYQFAYRPDGTVICRADYEIRNRNRQFLRVTLPPGAKVLLARVSEKSRPMTPLPGNKGEYLLPLERSTASVMGLVSFPVQVVYMYRTGALRSSGRGTVALPRIDVPIAYAWCQANMPGGMRRLKFSGVMRPVTQYSSETALASMTYGSATALDPDRKRLDQPEPEAVETYVSAKPDEGGGGGGGGLFGWFSLGSAKSVKPKSSISIYKPVTNPMTNSISLGGSGASPAGSLARNYWRAGQESYKQGKYDEADKSLSNVLKMFPKSPDAPNAKRLLANIKLLKGKLQVKGRAEKAAAVAVKQQISADNVDELQQQRELVEGGIQAAKQKDTKRAQTLFRAAEVLSKKLVARGENVIDQTARLRVARQQLDIARKTSGERLNQGLKQVKQLRQSGKIAEAVKLAGQLARYVDELAISSNGVGVGFKLQKEREQLALESARATLGNQNSDQTGLFDSGNTGLFDPGAGGTDSGIESQPRPDDQTFTFDGEFLDDIQAGFNISDKEAARKIYKVGDLLTGSDFDEKDGLKDISAREANRRERTSRLRRQVQSLLEDSRSGRVQTTTYDGQRAFVVTGGAREQEAVSKLIEGLRQARGAQVQVGANLALQRAGDQTADTSGLFDPGQASDQTGLFDPGGISSDKRHMTITNRIQGGDGKESRGAKLDPDLQKFIDKNYAWQKKPGRPDGSNSRVWQDAIEAEEREQIRQAKMQLIRQDEAPLGERVRDLTARARSLMAKRDFGAALEKLKQIRVLDPRNRWANEQMELLQNFAQLESEKGLIKDVIREQNLALQDVRRAEIPWHQEVNYPKNWKEITVRREAGTDEDRVVKKQLDTRVSKLDFEEMELSQVFQFLRDVSGANIHVKWRALALESIEPKTTVSVQMSNVTFRKALEAILKGVASDGEPGIGETGLDYSIDDGVITVSTKSDFKNETVVRVYDIRDMVTRVPKFEGTRRGRPTRGAGDKNRDATGLFDPGAGGDDNGDSLEGDLKSRSEMIGEIKTSIADTVERDSWRDAGGEAGAISEIGGQLVITQTKENHERTAELIAKLRKTKGLKGAVEGRKVFSDHRQAESEVDRVVQKQLDTRVSRLDFEDMELSNVFQFLRDVSGANIHVKWRALALESIEPKTTVNVHLENVTFRKALKTILKDVASGGEPGVGETGLGYLVDEGVITISTHADLGKQTVVRIYDLRDMIRTVMKSEGPRVSLGEIVSEIKTVVTDTVDRDSWRDAGGEAGGISAIGGQLVVTQTRGNHAKTANLIDTLRQARGLKPAARKRRIRDARRPAETEADRIVRKQLDKKVSKLDFEDMELSQVFQFLRDVSGANIHVKWKALALESIEAKTTVNVHLKNVTFSKALETILKGVATGGEPGVGETGLGYIINDGVVTVSTNADLGEQIVVRVYDLRDMIRVVVGSDLLGAPRSIKATGAGRKTRRKIILEMKTLVSDIVDRDSWRDAGGEAGVIGEKDEHLVITQSLDNHAKIVELLGKVRKTAGLKDIGPKAKTKADRVVRKQLDTRVSKVDFEDMEFSKVIQFLRDISGAKITVKWRALAKEGIEPTDTVNVHLANVTFRKSLETILRNVEIVRKMGLVYVVDKGAITISTKSDFAKRTVVRTYDIRDIIRAGAAMESPLWSCRNIIGAIQVLITDTVDRDSWRDAGGEAGALSRINGQLVITQTRANHDQIAELFGKFRETVDPKKASSQRRESTKRTRPDKTRSITARRKLDRAELSRKLRFNRGQKTNVSSLNINVDADAAGSLGINFHKGNNDVSFTVVDEAQFRTLMELDAAKRAVAGRHLDPNETRQDTIVGTDALLANSMTTNVTRSRDRGNTLDIADNPIYVTHEKYVLIDNNGYLTAVRAGEMQNWQEASKHVEFVQAPQTIEIPRVGELVKLEKTLVKPSDEMVVRFDYQWKGR
ncbi:MAG: hypothetical protein QGH60_06775 [Phycisphaerae bacterium]|jgi:hypothetical protein|nr:hypothetical protein [Phycisphaerae bacterium]